MNFHEIKTIIKVYVNFEFIRKRHSDILILENN